VHAENQAASGRAFSSTMASSRVAGYPAALKRSERSGDFRKSGHFPELSEAFERLVLDPAHALG
jgi:hypothetical protein